VIPGSSWADLPPSLPLSRESHLPPAINYQVVSSLLAQWQVRFKDSEDVWFPGELAWGI